jgi:7-keto-8-aminopelargonate synthetase-like enzyme
VITLNGEPGHYIQIAGKTYSIFSGNNYLGLSGHPEVRKAAREAIDRYGLNVAAARHTTGTTAIHLKLEKELSDFKKREDSVVFASGYMGNGILLNALRDRYDTIFVDEAGHPSILDGVPREITKVKSYKHCDVRDLEDLLKKNKNSRPLIITDGIFPLTGEISPLDEIYPVAEKYGAIIVTDDAHATGVLGECGIGTPEHFHLQDVPDIYQSDTLSKALGVYGGFISAGRDLIQGIRESSRTYLASTALPPPLASAACTSVRLIRQSPGLRTALSRNAAEIRKGITELGLQTSGSPTPIIPVYFDSLEKARQLSEYLKENGMIVPCVQYPVDMGKFITRIAVSTSHTGDQIQELIFLLKKWSSKHGVT